MRRLADTRFRQVRRTSWIAIVTAWILLVPLAPAQAERLTPSKIMPLGDSITHGTAVPGGYRRDLEDHLIAAKYDFNFVGTQTNGDSSLESRRHEGHKGHRIDQISASVDAWLTTHKPNFILLMIGTNDILQNHELSTAPDRLSGLIDQITSALPGAHVVVSSLTPLADPALDEKVRAYNSSIPGIVESKVDEGKLVSFVDMYEAITTTDLRDGIHPNANGYASMANTWLSALTPLLPSRPPPVQRSCPCSIWPNSSIAAQQSPITTARELGLKFRTDVPGHITGIRFYKKGPANGGTHIAHLWTRTGTLLATATYTNETDSGWQQVMFDSPVAVSSDTTYVASYYAPVGRFTVKAKYFLEQMEVNYPLRALAWGMSGANGVYRSGSSGFPTASSNANFWVDVVFEPA